jgi:transcriptional regulator GlxA family with amidase domain
LESELCTWLRRDVEIIIESSNENRLDLLNAGSYFEMQIAIITLEGFNEIDSFLSLSILNRVSKEKNWNVQITAPTATVTSMNGISIQAQQPINFANQADVVLFGSGIYSKRFSEDISIMSQFNLDPAIQLIGSQCSGALFLHQLGLVNNTPISTDRKTAKLFNANEVKVLEEPFYSAGNIATAGGCLSSLYLAAWVIWRTLGQAEVESAVQYVSPVGQEVEYLKLVRGVLSNFVNLPLASALKYEN